MLRVSAPFPRRAKSEPVRVILELHSLITLTGSLFMCIGDYSPHQPEHVRKQLVRFFEKCYFLRQTRTVECRMKRRPLGTLGAAWGQPGGSLATAKHDVIVACYSAHRRGAGKAMSGETRIAGLDEKACYAAFKAHDTRFDGRFFVGISSTGIYCRPVCRVKMPKMENCSYHSSAAAAEAEGFRPCLKCRPELAPGRSSLDAPALLAHKAARIMEEDCLEEGTLAGLADSLGVTDRHLRRVFALEYGVSPVRYLQTRKLLLAKSLLTDTDLSITDVALAAGFGSVRRFNDLFKEQYRLTPGALRKKGVEDREESREGITVFLGYRPPYGWNALIDFLAGRAIPGVESVAEGCYRRTVSLRAGERLHRGWISVAHAEKRSALAVTLSSGLLPVLGKVLGRVRALFDLNCDPLEIFDTLQSMNTGPKYLFVPGTRLPGCFAPFEMCVRAVLGQQVTVKAARTLAARFAAAFGEDFPTPFAELTRVFPSAEAIASLPAPVEDQLGPLGITGARARCLFALASALAKGRLSLSSLADPEAEMQKLLALPGFGPWTVQYVAMRALGWPDAFPHTDYGVKKALGDMPAKDILECAEAWKPWRSYATISLWHSLAVPAQ